jgi:DNA-binding YbaB/EbfC family protein
VFGQLGNLGEILKNFGAIRENMERASEELGKLEVEGTAGGGSVRARVNGRLELLGVRIEPRLLADGDVELLEDLVTAAVSQALGKAREAAAQKLTAGMPLPPGLLGGAGFPGFPPQP